MQIIKMLSQINFLIHLDGTNLHLDPFHQCKVTLNTICSEMKSTSRIEVCCLLATVVEQLFFWTPNTELRCVTC
jgi:hypothetical protein